jgi:hypothetical protein
MSNFTLSKEQFLWIASYSSSLSPVKGIDARGFSDGGIS